MFPNQEFEKLHDRHFVDEQEEEEALSFSDLPITQFIISNTGDDEDEDKEEKIGTNGDEPEFDFGSLVESGNGIKIEMCSADEVFSGGQILPFRHSVSSDPTRTANWRSVSVSESIESCSRSSSIRSSSIRSQFSNTSSSSNSTTSSNNTSISIKTVPLPKTRVQNTFHSHPSPKPHVWAPGPRGSTPNLRKSTMWDVLRLGLVRTPEIELQDLKQRHRSSTSSTPFIMARNNSYGSNNSRNSESKINDTGNDKMSDLLIELNKKKKKKNYNDGGFFKSCKCSVMAIEPIPSREYGGNIFGNNKILDGPKKGKIMSRNYYHVLKEDKEMAQKKVTVQEQEEQKEKKQQIRQGKKKVMSHRHHHHHRTFEWLKDLSHATVLNS